MFYIDNKKLTITKQEICVGKMTYNGVKGYNICINLEFLNKDNIKGYLHLDAGFERNDDINIFVNRKYMGIPYEIHDDQLISFEVFDTEKFLDTEIESKIVIILKDIQDNKFRTFFEVNDELIHIKFDGDLDIRK